MATKVNLVKGPLFKTGFIGFSWTTLFFGFLVPMFRGDWIMVLVMLLLQAMTCGLVGIILAFLYNKIYTRKLIENEGYMPADEYSRQLLIKAGILYR